jgi:hypothetical protein
MYYYSPIGVTDHMPKREKKEMAGEVRSLRPVMKMKGGTFSVAFYSLYFSEPSLFYTCVYLELWVYRCQTHA